MTEKTIAADLAAAFKAIDVCQPGDIVVLDSHESINTAFAYQSKALEQSEEKGEYAREI